ncbi:hypothetical protein ASE66_25940 [Bosea sp. Root483D1]|uniref:DUF805 domain-containing protein n=1 Tax=Bosea sp. Root483D1 TaxID=1736544 RepID=UPI000709F64E|nr:DUF805 domain-containing protein [Bosea sp. Root483D1]KRE22630.1 hypothetical protein ASE66_25940 [Bosea sp. Root483D1]
MTPAVTAFLAGFWRFDGRLARLAYVLRCVAAVVVFMGLMVLGAEAFGLTLADVPGPLFFVEPIPNAVLTLLFYWAVMALSAQRLRDMGFPVLPIIAALIGLELLEFFVLPDLITMRLPAPSETMTPPYLILSTVAYLWLLVWPSAKAGSDQVELT